MRKYPLVLIAFLVPYLGFAQKGIKPVIKSIAPQAVQVKSAEGFIHPGIGLGVSDLNRIQKMVRQGFEPWATAFDEFRETPKASKNYVIQNLDKHGKPKYEEIAEGNGQYESRRDADAAFAQTLMWYITGDSEYSDKALKILRSWSASLQRPTRDLLTGGMTMQKFCFAAEVLRYTPGSGWTEADTKDFTGFLNIMLSSTDRPTAFMNQGGIATMGYMSIAIFTNNKDLYAKAITRATVGTESQTPNKDYSIKNQIPEVMDPSTGKPVVVVVEMGRDQGHAQGNVGALGSLARTSFLQGTKVNSNGEIVSDGSGVNLFRFMNSRLLAGAGIAAKYNLGYDIVYPPINYGTDSKPEIYQTVSADGRGQLAAVFELLYNHYRYNENIPESDQDLKYLRQVKELNEIEGGSQDFFGNGTLLYSHEKAVQNPSKPKGPPKKLQIIDYSTKAKALNRIQAASFTGTKGDRTGSIGTEDYTDLDGTRPVISGVKDKFYAWYKDLDFGDKPVDKMLIRAGSAASNGCKIDVILLDKVSGIDWENLTEDNLKDGENIATIQTAATGWWTNFVVSSGTLNKKLSGKHSIALRFYGSGHVYRFQANVDWFKFVSSVENEPDMIPKQEFTALHADDLSIVYKGNAVLGKQSAAIKASPEGTMVVFPSVAFRNGPQTIAFKVKSNGGAILSLSNINKHARLTDPPFATVSIPDTKGKWTTLYAKINSDKKITGTQMVYMTLTGNNAVVDFKEIQFDPLVKD